MYKCEECNKLSEPRMRQYRVITEKREKHYFIYVFRKMRGEEQTISQFTERPKHLKEEMKKQGWELVQEMETKGWEIVKEKKICEECNEK